MICLNKDDKNIIPLFLSLPQLLYKGDNPQSKKTEKQILTGQHPLSNNMEVFPFVVVSEQNVPICRAILTFYSTDKTGYVGFFESKNDIDAVQLLFDKINEQAKNLGLQNLVGPINCSIYIGYRFKIDGFDEYFTGEPYNKQYYPMLWEQAGFSRCNRYFSYQIGKLSSEDSDEKLEKVLQWCVRKGFTFSSLKRKDFDTCLKQVYELMNRTYSRFIGFKPITCEQFCTMFSSLKYIVDFDMIKIARKNGKLCAFCICIPNYGNITLGKFTLSKAFRFLKIKNNADEYVVLYLGADEGCCGIGSALVHYLEKSFYIKQCTSIAALIKEDGLSNEYYKSKHIKKYTYALYSRVIEE